MAEHQPAGELRLLLVRHGQTFANEVGALDTAYPGAGLTDLGHRQAAAVGAHFDDPHLDSPHLGNTVSGIFVSGLRRTRQTAGPLAGRLGHDLVELPGLREIHAGEYEMLTDPEAAAGYFSVVSSWLTGDLARPMPGGETGHDFLRRFDAAIAQICAAASGGTAVAVSHGAAIRTWTTVRSTNGGDWLQAPRIHNTGYVELTGDCRSGWQIISWHGDPVGQPEGCPTA